MCYKEEMKMEVERTTTRCDKELVERAHRNGLCVAKICNIALKEASEKMEKSNIEVLKE